jgi:Anion-transporting ATPase
MPVAAAPWYTVPSLRSVCCACCAARVRCPSLLLQHAVHPVHCRHVGNKLCFKCSAVGTSRLLASRAKMQQRYLEQFDELYDGFHVVKLPLLEAEVRGLPAIQSFSRWLFEPYDFEGDIVEGDADPGGSLQRPTPS